MSDERQRVVRVAGSRRAKLTRAPGTSAEPDAADDDTADAGKPQRGPNDERMLDDVPPHY